ncbi:tetratricopeptide repeat protein [candidate division CSSED10-310 bacterium]|uniref:Tetratricopeptide repeat protein n=1 Tax=candidate division CSSED10-310 bacterium TaxID=2855610 RepID=A0ABV6Z482_UNCC1
MEILFEDDLDQYTSELAQHWERAENWHKSRQYYLEAAQRAKENYDFGAAEQWYRSYLDLLEEPSAESIVVRNEFAREVLQFRGKNQAALREHEQAMKESEMIGDQLLLAWSITYSGRVHWYAGDLRQAQSQLNRSFELFKKLDMRREEGIILSDFALLASEQGNMDEALAFYEGALSIHREVNNRNDELRTLSNLAILHQIQGRMEAAKELYNRVINAYQTLGNPEHEAKASGNLGILHFDLGEVEEAESLFLKAIAMYRAGGNKRNEGRVLGTLGDVYQQQGNSQKAITIYEQALTISRNMGDKISEGNILHNYALLHYMNNDVEQAMRLGQKAMALIEKIGDHYAAGSILGNLALFHGLLGHISEAWDLYEQVISSLQKVGDKYTEGIILGWMATLKRRTDGDLDQAEQLNRKARKFMNQVGIKHYAALQQCEGGHIAIARGTSAENVITSVQSQNLPLLRYPKSELRQAISKLERAEKAFQAKDKEQLFRGELLTDIPAGIRQWLRETGQLPPN